MLTKYASLTASAMGAAMLLFGAGSASAAPVSNAIPAQPVETGQIEQVWSGGYYGGYGGYGHYGYSPYRHYGHGPSIGFSLSVPGYYSHGLTAPRRHGSNAHVRWCSNRYKTYDPATDTYIPRVGERARCDSPYR